MLAAAFTAITPLEVVFFRKNDVAFRAAVKIFFFQRLSRT